MSTTLYGVPESLVRRMSDKQLARQLELSERHADDYAPTSKAAQHSRAYRRQLTAEISRRSA